MSTFLSSLSVIFIPGILSLVIFYGIYKKAPVYEYFIAGARDGLKTAVEMLPFIIAIFVGIEAITSSGAMDFFRMVLSPLFNLLKIPEELISLILLRPVSGSGSLVLAEQIMENSGTDGLIGRSASVMVGSCETVFYVLALYFGVTSVKNIRHAFSSGIIGYVAGIFASVYLSYILFTS